mmetsp:Transcript_18111/g.54140  ORF Transcript_18111/g.54140 Transcript_18111/m.54140 type:complete len:154 (+) Transcript_18111:826-1287(+)
MWHQCMGCSLAGWEVSRRTAMRMHVDRRAAMRPCGHTDARPRPRSHADACLPCGHEAMRPCGCMSTISAPISALDASQIFVKRVCSVRCIQTCCHLTLPGARGQIAAQKQPCRTSLGYVVPAGAGAGQPLKRSGGGRNDRTHTASSSPADTMA